MMPSTFLLPRLKPILYQHLSDPDFGILDFCEHLNISRSQLHRTITEQTGLSTSHYIRQLRLELAKELLTTTDLLVYEIAGAVGFKNVAYFSTSFLATFGYSPKDSRHNN